MIDAPGREGLNGGGTELTPRRAAPMAVAIDGPVASGKTAVGRMVAGGLGWRFLDTGAMYRAVTRSAIRLGVDIGDEQALGGLAAGISLRLEAGPDGAYRLWVDGEDVTGELRTPEIERSVSAVARGPRRAAGPGRAAESGCRGGSRGDGWPGHRHGRTWRRARQGLPDGLDRGAREAQKISRRRRGASTGSARTSRAATP